MVGLNAGRRAAFNSLFLLDSIFGQRNVDLPLGWYRRRLSASVDARLSGHGDGPRIVPGAELPPGVSPEEFQKRFVRRKQPVVLRGAANGWRSHGKWDMEFFAREYGDMVCPVRKNVAMENPGAEDPHAFDLEHATLKEIIESQGADPLYAVFLPILRWQPELEQDLDDRTIRRYGMLSPREQLWVKIFLGPGNAVTNLHCAGISNLFVQVYGKKRWVLFPPSQSMLLYQDPRYVNNWVSPVAFRKPNLTRYPLFRHTEGVEIVLDAGDILWVPPYWWHFVSSVTPSISLSYWWASLPNAFRSSPFKTVMNLPFYAALKLHAFDLDLMYKRYVPPDEREDIVSRAAARAHD